MHCELWDIRVVVANVVWDRTLIYLEGDATMNVYEDSNGKKQSGLNLVQTKVEVLKRPQTTEPVTA